MGRIVSDLEVVGEQVLELALLCVYCTARLVYNLVKLFGVFVLLFAIAYCFFIAKFTVVEGAIITDKGVSILTKIIDGVLTAANGFASAFGSHVKHNYKSRDIVGSWIDKAEAIPHVCNEFDSWQLEMGFLLKALTHDTLCPVVRYVYPVKWLYTIFDGMFGWMIFNPTPGAYPGNCRRPPLAWLCWWLNLGYVFRDLCIPLLLYCAIIDAAWPLITFLYNDVKRVVRDGQRELADALHTAKQVVHEKSIKHRYHKPIQIQRPQVHL